MKTTVISIMLCAGLCLLLPMLLLTVSRVGLFVLKEPQARWRGRRARAIVWLSALLGLLVLYTAICAWRRW